MMGRQCDGQASLLYEFRLEDRVPGDHLLRKIDRFLDLGTLRRELAPFYSSMGRPSVDPELLIRMLIVGYCFGIRSERRLCEEVDLNLAYRWFCRLGLEDEVPTIPRSARTAMDGSGRAISSAKYSRPCCAAAWLRVLCAAKDLRSMRR